MSIWVRAALYMLLVGGTHFVVLPALVLSAERRHRDAGPVGWRRPFPFPGVGLFALGAALATIAARYLIVQGRGTPFPLDPTRELVTTGPYRYVRNPQGIAATLMITGEVVAIRSRWLWLLIPLTLGYLEGLAAPIEDRQLRRQFGARYGAYKRAVPKWLPRRRRRS